MKNSRLQKYLANQANSLTNKKQVVQSTRKEDFPVYQNEDSKSSATTAIPNVGRDSASVASDFIIMDMPEVKDIPGQENIKPPHMREMMDVTISSADEEGEGLLDDLNREDDDDNDLDDTNNVSPSEKRLLEKADRPVTEEQVDRKKLALDTTDGDDVLNEESDPSDLGKDLDVPGADLDDDDEAVGEEDEENNTYSNPD